MTDTELLVASRHDPAAFRELYDRWAERLLAGYVLSMVLARVADRSRPRSEELAAALR